MMSEIIHFYWKSEEIFTLWRHRDV